MRILSLYVENFGGLSSFSMNFDDGMMVLHQPNGWGKSSLAVFIKAMLYGLPASTKRSLIENERKRYTPWQGGVFGGSMDVQLGEKRLRIERRFGEKESMDTLVLTDLNTGVMVDPPQRQTLGEEWFGVDAAAYERSTYLSQRPTDESDGNLSIHAKLNRLIDATDDIGSFDHAMELLEKQRKFYSLNSGRRGAIADEQARLAELETAYAHCVEQATEAQSSANELERLQQSLRENRAQSEQLAMEERALHLLRETRAKASHLEQLKALLAREQNSLDAVLSAVGGQVPTEEQLSALEQQEEEIAATTLLIHQKQAALGADQPGVRQLASLQQYFGEHVPTDEELAALRQAAGEAQNAAQRHRDHQNEAVQPAPMQESETPTQNEAEMTKYRRFCMQYPTERAKYEQAVSTSAAKMAETERLAENKKKTGTRLAVAAICCTAVGVVLCLVLLALQPSLLWLPLVAGALGVLVCVIGRSRATVAARAAQAALSDAQSEVRQTQEKRNTLLQQWKAVCRRLGEISGTEVSDSAQALEVLAAQEAAAQRAIAEREERERARLLYAQKEQELDALAKTSRAAWQALWHWEKISSVQDAPVAVERLSQRVSRYRALRDEIAALQASLAALKERLAALQSARAVQLIPFGQAGRQSAAAVWLREICAKATVGAENVKALQCQIDEFWAQNGQELQAMQDTLTPLPDEEREAQMDAEKKALEEQAQALQRQIALTRRALQQQSEAAAAMDSVQDEIVASRQSLEDSRMALNIVQETQKYMKQAKDALSGRYLQRMKDSFAAYLAELSGEQDAVFTMDGGFVVKLRRGGASRTKEAFSTGQRDVISLCARLALVDALFEEEAPFLVLDDPFANMDDTTAQRSRMLLESAAEKYQILYLTCHSSRS